MGLGLNRRQLLASAEAAALAERVPAMLAAQATLITRAGLATGNHFGELSHDPCSWMEQEDPGWLPLLKAQNDRPHALLDALPGRLTLAAHPAAVRGYGGDLLRPACRRQAVLPAAPPGGDNLKLFVREGGWDRC